MNDGHLLETSLFHLRVSTVCAHLLEGCGGGGGDAVGSVSQPLPPHSPLASLPLTSHLPCGLPPADRRWLILPSFHFCLPFFFILFLLHSLLSSLSQTGQQGLTANLTL